MCGVYKVSFEFSPACNVSLLLNSRPTSSLSHMVDKSLIYQITTNDDSAMSKLPVKAGENFMKLN